MGRSYDALYFFGSISSDGEDRRHEDTRAAFGGDRDFEEWLNFFCGVTGYPSGDRNAYRAWAADRDKRIADRFGCLFEECYIGYNEYPAYGIYPKDARAWDCRYGKVPTWTPEQIEHWRQCMERLREVLPGLSEPGLYYGCSVG
jgi:hypothetical protein